MKNYKMPLIIASVVVAVGLMFAGMFVSTNNKAINLEEQIHEASASIEVQEKRRIDLVYNLVDTVQAYADHEKSTLQAVTEARANVKGGNIEEAQMVLQAVGEAYPELKSNENYKQLMTELSLTENMIAEHRNNLNMQIKSYKKFCRKFPNSFILNVLGYEVVEATYTEYNAPADAPQNLFGEH